MKLVDILAWELKVWPEGVLAIEQDKRGTCLFRVDGEPIPNYVGSLADDAETAKVTRAEWQAAVDALNAPKVVEWDKGSLPPIGSVVEWDGCTFDPEEPQEKDLHVGDHVTIISHLKDGDFELAAFTFNPKIHNPNRGSIWVNQGTYGCFRPIRTAEQLAEEEREKEAIDLYLTMQPASNSKAWDNIGDYARDMYRLAISSGYRKQ